MSPKPFVDQQHTTSQYEPHPEACPCPPCTTYREQHPPSWAPIRRVFLRSLPILVALTILGLLIVHSAQAREGGIKPIPAPPALLKARAACPFNHPLKCRAALVHAYEAIAWAKTLRTHRNAAAPLERVSQWLCIHHGEGAWTANTGNGYHGGLQMDWSFMRTYGADMLAKYDAPAEAWTPRDQMIVANRAYATRGYHPWPVTARACGLL